MLDPGTHLKPGAPPALLTAPHDSQVEQSEISGESAEGGGREGHGWRGVVWCDAALCGVVWRAVRRGAARCVTRTPSFGSHRIAVQI